VRSSVAVALLQTCQQPKHAGMAHETQPRPTTAGFTRMWALMGAAHGCSCRLHSAHLWGSHSANLYSTCVPAGSSIVAVQRSPSFHVMCGARASSQPPSESVLPTSTSS